MHPSLHGRRARRARRTHHHGLAAASLLTAGLLSVAGGARAQAEPPVAPGSRDVPTPLADSQAPAAAPASPAVAADRPLDPVVVVGTKRSQGRQQATQSVTVAREEDTIGLQSTFDLLARVPNVSFESGSFLPTVRGVNGNGIATGGGGAVTGANARMVNYVDGVARTYGATPDGQGSFWDMAQVEIFRGAQSTLLGQNALAGAIVQTTQDPVFEDEYALQLGVRNERTTVNGAFMLNKALGENVAVRFTGEAIDGRNAIDYSGFPGTGLTADDRDDLGRIRYGRYRLKALVEPSRAVSLKLIAEFERRRNPYAKDLASVGRGRAVTSVGDYGSFDSDTHVLALNGNVEIDPQWTFDAVLSQQKATTRFGPPVVGNPDPSAFLDFTFESTETALEPKLVYRAGQGRTGAVIGAFAKKRERDDLGRPGSVFALTADDEASSRSVFADATLQLAPHWDLLAAGRYIDDRQSRDFAAFGGALAYDFSERNRVFLPKIGATYHHTPDAALSLLFYKGYNAGGGGVSFVTFTPYRYEKETASTIELAARTQWLDRRLTANANLFFTRIRDLQVSGIGPAGPNDGIYVNIDKARTRGLELDLDWRPSDRARLGVAVGLLDTRIVDFGSAANNASNGNRLGLSPRGTASLRGSYELMPRLVVGGDLFLSTGRHTDYTNAAADRLPGYGVANAHLRYRYGSVTLTGYVNNLFDKFVEYQRTTAFGQANVNDPRTIGVNARVDF